MADQKITDLTADATPSSDDLIVTVNDPSGTPTNKKVTLANLVSALDLATEAYVDTQVGGGSTGRLFIADGLSEEYDRTPATTQTENDEFAGGSLDAKWSVITNTVGSVDFASVWKSHLSVAVTGNAQAYIIEQAYAPGGDFNLALCARVPSYVNGNNVAIRVMDSGNTNAMAFQFVSNSNVMQARLDSLDSGTPANRASYNLTGTAFWADKVYISLQRTSNTWTAAISYDGMTWVEVGTYSKTFTVHHFRIELNSNGAGLITKSRMGFDWLRRDFITLP